MRVCSRQMPQRSSSTKISAYQRAGVTGALRSFNHLPSIERSSSFSMLATAKVDGNSRFPLPLVLTGAYAALAAANGAAPTVRGVAAAMAD